MSRVVLVLFAVVLGVSAQSATNIWNLYDRTQTLTSNVANYAAASDITTATSSLQVRLDAMASMATDTLNGHLATLKDQTTSSLSGAIDSMTSVTSNLNSLTGSRLDNTATDLTSMQTAVSVDADASVAASLSNARSLISAATASSWSRLQSLDGQLSTYMSQVKSDFDNEVSSLKATYASMSTTNSQIAVRVSTTVSSITSMQTRATTLFTALDVTSYGNPRVVVYRYGIWSTYSQYNGWYAGNSAALYAGINPSSWGDSNAVVWSVTNSKDAWRTLFNKIGYGGYSTTIWAEEWYSYSSTNSRHIGTLFRIKNTTPAAIAWTVYWYYSCYGGWNEYASASLNGAGTFSDSNNCAYCTVSLSLSIPASRTSTLMLVSASSSQSGTRALYSGFYNDCLNLPTGLVFADDMDGATGGWES